MKITEFIEKLQKILIKEGDLEIYEEFLDEEENSTGAWYSVNPVIRHKNEVQIHACYDFLPNKFVSLE